MPALRSITLAVVVIACGCGGAGRDGDTTPAAGAGTHDPPAAVELAEITVYEDDQPLVRLHADGTSEVARSALHDTADAGWDPGPTIAADGTVTIDGAAVWQITAGGTIVDLRTQTNMPITLTPDRVTAARDGTIHGFALAASGQVSRIAGEVTTALPIRVEGASTATLRRTVLAFLVVLFQRTDAQDS
jgi:hypothetical protein